MRRSIVIVLSMFLMMACNPQPEERPSGLKNMAPLPKGERVESGLDVEPNDTFMQASSVSLTGDSLQWEGVLTPGDVDVWRVKAKSGSVVDVTVTPEDTADIIVDYSPIESASARRYYDMGFGGASEYLPHIRLSPEGGFLTVQARGAKTDVKYRVTVARVFPGDGIVIDEEPNETPQEGVVLSVPSVVEGMIYPTGDEDYYRLSLSSPALVEFTMPNGAYEASIGVGETVQWRMESLQAQPLTPPMLMPSQEPYWIRVAGLEAAPKDGSGTYRIDVRGVESVPDEIEPNDTFAQAQILRGAVQDLEFTLKDASDVDYFRIEMPAGHVYRARLTGVSAGAAQLEALDAQGAVLSTPVGDGLSLCDVADSGNGMFHVRVRAGERYEGAWPLAYRLEVESEAADGIEHEPNQTEATATLLNDGMRMVGHIYPDGDEDVYRIDVPGREGWTGTVGNLNITVEAGYAGRLQLRLVDKDGFVISQARSVQISRPVNVSFDAPAGTYYLKVSGDNDRCMKPYVLRSLLTVSDAYLNANTTGANPNVVPQPGNSQPNVVPPSAPQQGPAHQQVNEEEIADLLKAAGVVDNAVAPTALPGEKQQPVEKQQPAQPAAPAAPVVPQANDIDEDVF